MKLTDVLPGRSGRDALARANALAEEGRVDDALRQLRGLSIRDFGEVFLDLPDRYAALRRSLPEMPADQIQRDWTGSAGPDLLRQTVAFVRSVETAFAELCGRPLTDATILDYGCGWGRILRLMYRYSDPSKIYGLDPWESSLGICRKTGVLGNLALCDDVPRALPFPGVAFDLVYAFSVFTHLSEKTATAVLGAIRRRIRDDGLLALTIRPDTYWTVHTGFPAGTNARALQAAHAEKGFAFVPHQRVPIEGDITFGDTSISLDYVRRHWTEWDLSGQKVNDLDPYQLVLFLRPR